MVTFDFSGPGKTDTQLEAFVRRAECQLRCSNMPPPPVNTSQGTYTPPPLVNTSQGSDTPPPVNTS